MVVLVVVVSFPNAGHGSYPYWSKAKDVGGSHVVDVWCYPASIVELPEMAASFMVSSNEDSEIWCMTFAAVVFVEVTELTELGWDRHDSEIEDIANCLVPVN